MTVHVLIEHEPSSEYPAVVIGVFTTPEAMEAAKVARIAQRKAESDDVNIWNDTDEDGEYVQDADWNLEYIEETAELDLAETSDRAGTDCPECGRNHCKCERLVSFRFRPNDPRAVPEERQLTGYWGERDTWGKRAFRHDPNTTDDTTVYAFDDEIVTDEPA